MQIRDDDVNSGRYEVFSHLAEQAMRDQEAIENSIQALDGAIAALKRETSALPGEVSRKISGIVSSSADVVAKEVTEQFVRVVNEVTEKFARASQQAEKARSAYEHAAKFAVGKIIIIAALCFLFGVVGVIAVVHYVIPDPGQLQALRAEKAELEQTVSLLEQHGGRADVRTCQVSGEPRLCIRIDDEPARVRVGPNNNGHYRVIYGY